jgi:hypothetical protein
MPPKPIPKPQTKAEDSTSDHDDAHEERITALENNVQSINSKLDQILASLAAQQQQAQRLPPSEATVKDTKPIPLKSSNVSFDATVKDIGLFDPIEDKEAVWTENKETVYGDVILFTNKLRRIATRKIVHGYTIGDCLRGRAIAWYEGTNPEELEQADIEQWCTALLAQFGTPREVAIRTLKRTRYTTHDAVSGIALTSYYDRICRGARALGYSEQQTKDFIFENIYAEIAVHLLDLKTLKLTEIRVHFMQRQLLVSNLCQSLYATSTSPSPHQKAVEAPPTQWRNQRNTRRTLYMEQPDPGGGSDVNGANISL